MQVTFRPAVPEDFDYCARLYFAGRERAIQESNLDMAALVADLRQRWEATQVRIITLDAADIGWLQSTLKDDALFIVQFFIDPPFQGRGIGTEVLRRIIDEGRELDKAVTLGVVKTNPALRLYERHGFQTTHEDERKFYMRRDLGKRSS
jgi:GNAT superfamily N-acetyltransferase